ncbi:MAG: protein TolQ [Alphaproteobacteria bacterium]|nr:protein TolQ [Alphaproteobacteria bacterium]
METEAINAISGGANLSMWALFWQADLIVKLVILALLSASVWSWAIIIEKVICFRRIRAGMRKFEDKFWSGMPLEKLYAEVKDDRKNPMAVIFSAATKEWKTSGFVVENGTHVMGLQQRIERVMKITLDREIGKMETRMTFLASTGAVAPFVGLFGTVWGIMNSFHAIGLSNNTSLAVVAPGIAEALFATALGLVAAIPAVIAYNKLSSDIDKIAVRLENFAGEFAAIMSRQIDMKTVKAKGN